MSYQKCANCGAKCDPTYQACPSCGAITLEEVTNSAITIAKFYIDGQTQCKGCGRPVRFESDFESQWTAIEVEHVVVFYCPTCFGIPDPAPAECRRRGHRWNRHGCWRCGTFKPEGE